MPEAQSVTAAARAIPPPAATEPAAIESRRIPLTSLMPCRFQAREEFDEQELKNLAASIQTRGVIEPIVVRPAGDKYEIIAGERRWRASKLAGLADIPATIHPDLKDQDAQVLHLVENLQRVDLTLAEQCAGIDALVKQVGVQKAAIEIGKSEGWVSKRASVENLAEDLRELVTVGAIKDVEIVHGLAELREIDSEEAGYFAQQLAKPDPYEPAVTRDTLREAVREAKARIKRREEQERQAARELKAKAEGKAAPPPKNEQPYERERRLHEEAMAEVEPQMRKFARDTRKAILGEIEKKAGKLAEGFQFSIGKRYHYEKAPKNAATAGYSVELAGRSSDAGLLIEALKPSLPIRIGLTVTIEQFRAIEKVIGQQLWIREQFESAGAQLSGAASAIAGAAVETKADAAGLPDKNQSGVGVFLKLRVNRADVSAKIKAGTLYAAYKAWCKQNKVTPIAMNDNAWGAAIDKAGIEKKRTKAGIHYLAIALSK